MPKMYAGLDVSQKTTEICIVDANANVILQAQTLSTPAAISKVLLPYRRSLSGVGHETGLFTPWLQRELIQRRFPAMCLDARQTRAALAGQRNKTDKNDARDIAVALARGFDRTAYVKSEQSYRLRLLLTYRRALKRKAQDLEAVIRSSVKPFGARYDAAKGRVVTIAGKKPPDQFVAELSQSLLAARTTLVVESKRLELMIRTIAFKDPVCKRLMTAPGIGPITSLTFRAAIDDPKHFASSRDVGAHFGLTPHRRQSGMSNPHRGISRCGDAEVRAALYEAAATMLNCCKRSSSLRTWGLRLVETKGFKFASTACARKLAVILHRMWITGADFAPEHGPI